MMYFSVYKSSAGSGKTFSLAKEYLALVIKHPSKFQHILALTFTNKAAGEMKSRILKYLVELSTAQYNPDSMVASVLLPLLQNETGLTRAQISERAGQVLRSVLHHYGDFKVCTIDSFMYKVVKVFAYDLHLPVNFEVELEADELLSQTIDLMISRVGSDEALTRVLVDYTCSLADEEKNFNIEHDLSDYANMLLKEHDARHLQTLKSLTFSDFILIRRQVDEALESIRSALVLLGRRCCELFAEAGVGPEDLFQGKNGLWRFTMKLAAGNLSDMQPNSHVVKTLGEDKWYGGGASESQRAAVDRVKETVASLCLQAIRLLVDNKTKISLFRTIRKKLFPMALLNELQKTLGALKEDKHLVHISEFNQRIATIVMNEPVPYIYERLGERYRHLLIDEFQDTSGMQWLNLLPLIENSLSEGCFNLVVGDGKQAIYRWRGGDVKQFCQLPEIDLPAECHFGGDRQALIRRSYQEHLLNQNYRSKVEIVHFNNVFFRYLTPFLSPLWRKVYDGSEQQVDPGRAGGFVHLELLDKDALREAGVLLYLEKIMSRIHALIDAGYTFRDIAIICRTNDQGSQVARFLVAEKIQVVSSESLLLGKSPVVNFIMAVAAFVHHPDNTVVRIEMLRFLSAVGRASSEGLDAEVRLCLQDLPHFLKALSLHGYHVQLDELKSRPVYDMLESVIRIFHLQEPVCAEVQFLLDHAHQVSQKYGYGLGDFLEWWQEKKHHLSVIVPEDLNAVRILTIHKAKGLEFPVVIMPFATEEIRPGRESVWVPVDHKELTPLTYVKLGLNKDLLDTDYAAYYQDELERLRLDMVNHLYVALTRPTEQLYIITENRDAEPDELNSLPQAFKGFLKHNQLWDNEKRAYTFGHFEAREQRACKPAATIRLANMTSSEWRNKILLRTRAPEYWDVTQPGRESDRGLMVHRLLAGVMVHDDIYAALDQAYAQGMVSEQEKQALATKMSLLIRHEKLAPCFAPGLHVKCEKEIMRAGGASFRPDRIVFDVHATTVVDYKTGSHDAQHIDQIRNYGALLQEMKYPNVKMLLAYIDTGEVMDVAG